VYADGLTNDLDLVEVDLAVLVNVKHVEYAHRLDQGLSARIFEELYRLLLAALLRDGPELRRHLRELRFGWRVVVSRLLLLARLFH
jgi:hypothetical protein